MKVKSPRKLKQALFAAALLNASTAAFAADVELLNILLENRAITQEQYDALVQRDSITSGDIIQQPSSEASQVEVIDLEERIAAQISEQVEAEFPVVATQTSSGFRLETRDGNWRTDLQWRAQTRFTTPYRSDPSGRA